MVEPAGGITMAVRQTTDATIAQSQQMVDSAKKLLFAAQSGGFGFQPEAADIMLAALHDSIADLNSLNDSLMLISQAPKLGRTPAARVVSPFTQQVATDGQGIVRVIENLRQILQDMISAYQEAAKHYNETDTIAARQLNQLHK